MKSEFVSALLEAYDLVYGKHLSDRAATLFCNAVTASGITFEQACEAIAKHIADPKRGQFPPKPADIVAQVEGDNPGESKALDAWTKVLQAQSAKNAVYRPVGFDDPKIYGALESMGGWCTVYDEITHLKNAGESLKWVKKDFLDSYKASRGGKVTLMVARKSDFTKRPLILGNTKEFAALESKEAKGPKVIPLPNIKRIGESNADTNAH